VAQFIRLFWKFGKSTSERSQYLSGMVKVKEVHHSVVAFFVAFYTKFFEKSVRLHLKFTPHNHDALEATAVTLPKGLYQFGIQFPLLGMKPLLELIED